MVLPLVAFGQDEQSEEHPSEVTGSVTLDVLGPFPHVQVPGRWTLLPLSLRNGRNEKFEAFCATSLGTDANIQYCRRVGVPPHSRLVTWQPILISDEVPPEEVGQGIQELERRSLLFDGQSSDSELLREKLGSLQISDDLWLARPGPVAGIVEPPGTAFDRINPHVIPPSDVVEAGRMLQGQYHNLIYMDRGLPPGGEESIDAFDHLIIAANSVTHDPMAVRALRQWLFGGGRLWVMLDRTDDAILEALLGDAYSGQIVDRVSLTSVKIEAAPGKIPVKEKRNAFDKPVEFVRMLIDGDPAYTVNGWPAAYWTSCGEGQLLVTTLGPSAWIHPVAAMRESQQIDNSWRTDFYPGPAMGQISTEFFVSRPASLLEPEVLETHVREYVGYTIPSRGLVVGILCGFAAVLIGLGSWLLRIGEAQRLAIFGSLAALVTSVALMGVGRLHRWMPSTTAVLQFVHVIPGTNEVRVTGTAATYVSDAGAVGFSSDRGGWLIPEMAGQEGVTRRLVWSGLDQWQWENLQYAPGLHTSRFQTAAVLEDRTTAHASFDSAGLTGRFTLQDGMTATDPILVTPSGRMRVEIAEDGSYRASASDVLRTDQFLGTGLLSDEQTRRSRTLSSLLQGLNRGVFPTGPTMLFWTAPWDLGTQFPTGPAASGSALVALPLTLGRPAVGTSVLIPSPFLPYTEGYGPQNESPSGLFDYRSGEWQLRYLPSKAWLSIALPAELAPLQLTRVMMTIDVDGPAGRLDVASIQQEKVIPIKSWKDPQGTLTCSWTDPEILRLDEHGSLRVQIAIGDPERPELTQDPDDGNVTYFLIKSLSLEIEATILDPNVDGLPQPKGVD